MNRRALLDACPYCGEDLAALQAAALLEAQAVPDKVDGTASKAEILGRVRQLEQSLESLDEFGYRASHDLKEPLRKIVSFGDLLEYELGTELTTDARDYLGSMKRAASRLGVLVDRLLEYSRATRFEPRSEEVKLARMLEQLRGDCAEPIRQTGAFFSLGYLPPVRGDGDRIARVVREFLDNAFRFHNPRRKGLMLQVWAELGRDLNEFPAEPKFMGKDLNPVEPARARWCRISVRDNGRGFPTADHRRIFEPFVRLGQTRENEGSGLGLAISRRIAERLGGRVSAVGHLDTGATFSLWLPVKS